MTDGAQFLQAAPWLALIPAALIFLTVLSINFMGDGLRDAFGSATAAVNLCACAVICLTLSFHL